jgi:hypothetical protein
MWRHKKWTINELLHYYNENIAFICITIKWNVEVGGVNMKNIINKLLQYYNGTVSRLGIAVKWHKIKKYCS